MIAIVSPEDLLDTGGARGDGVVGMGVGWDGQRIFYFLPSVFKDSYLDIEFFADGFVFNNLNISSQLR